MSQDAADRAPNLPPPAGDGAEGVDLAAPEAARCTRCGYALRGILVSGACPECGFLVQRSVEALARPDMLEHASPAYLRRLIAGAWLVALGVLADVAWFVGMLVIAVWTGHGLSEKGTLVFMVSTGFASAVITLAGWWLLTEPDPAHPRVASDDRLRRLIRGLVVFIFAGAVVGLAGVLVEPLSKMGLFAVAGNIHIGPGTTWTLVFTGAIALRLLLYVARISRFFAGLMYVRQLAVRLSDDRLRGKAGRLLWLFPLLSTAGLLFVGLGPVVALGIYLGLFVILARRLRAVLTRSEAEPVPS
jgi:hypothetical protein